MINSMSSQSKSLPRRAALACLGLGFGQRLGRHRPNGKAIVTAIGYGGQLLEECWVTRDIRKKYKR